VPRSAAPAAFLAAFAAVVGLGAADGGYFPSQWGLATLGFVLVGVTVLVVAEPSTPSRRELVFVGGLTLVAGWTALSALWSAGAGAPVLDAERGVLYVAAAAAALLLLALPGAAPGLLGGVVAGAVALSLYGLATRLFPGHVGGAYEPAGYQLAQPIGYANALAMVVVVGILLSVGFTAHGCLRVRVAGASSLVVLLPTLYFTVSRGAIGALVAGFILQALIDPGRRRLLTVSVPLAAPAALAVLILPRFPGLTTHGAELEAAQHDGSRFALILVVLSVVAAFAAILLERRHRRSRASPRTSGRVLTAVALVTIVVAVPLGVIAASRSEGLVSSAGSGRGEWWHVATTMVADEPLLGTGAGSFEARFVREGSLGLPARDAHNLYLETLAELGPVGLALLLATVAVPLTAIPQASRSSVVGPAAAAAFVAYFLQAALDWTWEIPVATVPALLCAAVLLAEAREPNRLLLAGRRRAVALALAAPVLALALVMHVGNGAAAASAEAANRDEPERALREAKRAIAWAPWSEEPWQLRGEAELLLDDDAAAQRSFERSLQLNPDNWVVWLNLAAVTDGAEHAHALDRAAALNPLAIGADDLRTKP
jgi:O-antigen ligase/polysaccharide polymerase Wzy-like membrane protein